MYQNIDPPQNPLKVLRSLSSHSAATPLARLHRGWAHQARAGVRRGSQRQEGLAQGRVAARKRISPIEIVWLFASQIDFDPGKLPIIPFQGTGA